MKRYWENAACCWSDDSIRIISTPSVEARSTFYYVQEIGHFHTFYPFLTERQYLQSYLIVYTVSGCGELFYQGERYVLNMGDIFFIDCHDYQRYEAIEGEPWEILWVHINGSATDKYYRQFSKGQDPIRKIHHHVQIPQILSELLLLYQVDSTSTKTEILSSKLIVELLSELLLKDYSSLVSEQKIPDYIVTMKRVLEANFQQKLTLTGLSRQFAVNKYQLAKEFKRYTGFSPNEYLITRRVTKAKELLKYTDMPVANIASEVGIDNVSHFINLFKDRVESTPLSFRKHWQDRVGVSEKVLRKSDIFYPVNSKR